jgi:hypothetical protein
MRRQIRYGGIDFLTYGEAKDHYRKIKNEAPKNTWLTDPFLLDVYNCNPFISFNIAAVKFVRHDVDRFTDWGVIVRGADGELHDRPISNKYAFGNQSLAARNNKRLRLLIQPEADEYRTVMLEAAEACHHCGIAPGCEADHRVTFVSIVNDWLQQAGIDHATLRWKPINGDRWFQLLPQELENDWLTYHTTRCEWQWLCGPCHKKKSANER